MIRNCVSVLVLARPVQEWVALNQLTASLMREEKPPLEGFLGVGR